MNVAFLYGHWCLGDRPIDFNNLLDSNRGLTGSELSFIEYAVGMKKLGHEVHIFVPSTCRSNGFYCEIPVFDIDSLCKENSNLYDCVIAWNEPDLLRRVDSSCLRVLNQQLNDFDYCSVGFFECVDIFTSPSPGHKSFIQNLVPNSRWEILPNGTRKRNIFMDKDPFSVIYTSSPDRGLHILLEAWPSVLKSVPEAKLRIFYNFDSWFERMRGLSYHPDLALRECSYRAYYVKECLQRLSNHGVSHFGSVSRRKIEEEVLKSEVMAYPCDPVRYTEGFSVSLMEGCASGCAVLTSDADALGSIYDGYAMIVNRSQNFMGDFRDSLISLLNDDNLRRNTQDKCMELSSKYDWDRLTLTLQNIIERGIEDKKSCQF